jgi:acyl-CoA synthetase (NDP forming)
VSGIVLGSGKRLSLDDFSSDERAAPAAREHLHLGPAVVVPLGAPGNVRGILTAGRRPGSMPLAPPAVEMLTSFAAQAGIGLELAEHRRDAERLAVFEDRDRIARDLHDLVIQRLYATGMSLQSLAARLGESENGRRVGTAVDAVAGVGPGSAGRAILRNILGGGYGGRVYVLDPRAGEVGGVACLPSPAELPEPVDLVLVCVPAPAVLDLAEECGRRGAGALAVVTPGLEPGGRAALLACCRRHGMRLVGPASLGIAVPGISLNATVAATHPAPGMAGLGVQSGGIGTALLDQLTRLGIGISSFAALGEKADVSGNDLLMWWEQDPGTRLAVLGLESFGNPRKFGRTARHAGATMPVLTVHAGRSGPGPPGPETPVAAAASPAVSREALFGQAGIIAVRDLGELIEAAALLASQPVPAGRRVAIVSNAAGAGVLAADACADAGLSNAVLDGDVRQRIRPLLPRDAEVTGPVDATAAVSPEAFRTCLERVAADGGVDAVLALTALGDLAPAVCSADVAKPLALAVLSQAETVRLLPGRPGAAGPVPAYASPASAARALAHAARYGAGRASPPGRTC